MRSRREGCSARERLPLSNFETVSFLVRRVQWRPHDGARIITDRRPHCSVAPIDSGVRRVTLSSPFTTNTKPSLSTCAELRGVGVCQRLAEHHGRAMRAIAPLFISVLVSLPACGAAVESGQREVLPLRPGARLSGGGGSSRSLRRRGSEDLEQGDRRSP